MDVRFPDGTHVRAAGVAMRLEQAGWRDYGLYCDAAWAPDWPAEIIDWPDFGIPADVSATLWQQGEKPLVVLDTLLLDGAGK